MSNQVLNNQQSNKGRDQKASQQNDMELKKVPGSASGQSMDKKSPTNMKTKSPSQDDEDDNA